jgi:hypothetical protein
VEASSSGAFPFLRTTFGSVTGVARGSCGCDRVCLPLEATIKTTGSLQWSRHNGVAKRTVAISIVLISDAPSESVDRCRSILGKIFNFVPGDGARNVGNGSHPWIANRRRARRPSFLCHSGFLWVIKWTETQGDVTLTQRLGPACMKQRRS